MSKTKVSKSKGLKIIRALKKDEAFITEGVPPYVGRKDLLERVDHEFDEIEKGESMFRIVKGGFGAGKTHFLNIIREKAFKKDFIVSTMTLSPKEATLNKIEKVYKRFIKNLRANKFRKASALDFLLSKWAKEADTKNYSYCRHGMKPFTCGYPICRVPKEFHVLKSDLQSALRVCRDEWKYGNGKVTTNLDLVLKWFSGAKVLLREIRTIGIENRIDRNNTIEYMGEVCKLINHLGHKGIVILLDEDVPYSTVASDKTLESFKNLALIRNRLIRIPHIYIVYTSCPDFYELITGEDSLHEKEKNINTAELLDIPIEFMNIPASVKEIENMTLTLNSFTSKEAEEISQNFIELYEVSYDWSVTEDLYSKIFRDFIPHAVESKAQAKTIYSNLLVMLDTARQEGNESLQGVDVTQLKWITEYQ